MRVIGFAADVAIHPHIQHSDPASTYWYLEAVPELMALISARLEQLPEALA